MELKELIKDVSDVELIGDDKVQVKGIEFNLRNPLKNKAVVLLENALKNYDCKVEDVEKKGASCIISQEKIETVLPNIVVKNIRRAFSQISANYYDRPNEKMKFVFVTGTNGKTSTTNIIGKILLH